MVSDINQIKSHPDKLLLAHIEGVRKNVKRLTNTKLAELVAVFHDLGKINPNFQDKLYPDRYSNGYSNHAYLSAYAFFCIFAGSSDNREKLKKKLEWDSITNNDIIGITVLIAKHHGNLPDFEPEDYDHSGRTILSKDENKSMFSFINSIDLPIDEYVSNFFDVSSVNSSLRNNKIQECFLNKFIFQHKKENNPQPLDFFLNYQFAFANLIQADKADAANFDNFIERQKNDVVEFGKEYSIVLDKYLSTLNQDSDINKLRTIIREEAITKLKESISDRRVFELTAPTGSGKTLMLLSLASEIIKQKGVKRIIYGLPFLSITEQVESEVNKIFKGYENHIQRIDSKSENKRYEDLQNQLDGNSKEVIINELNLLEFQENTFAYPFVITTFVRFFETLLSNRNSELLKLPNFSNCIFLLDEIQSLPPRLYGFFIGYITKFCEMFNSYAIVSTATQPDFSLQQNNIDAKCFFPDYKKPESLLSLNFFNNELFNRYNVKLEKETIKLSQLREKIISENKSILVILNTIDDTKELYDLLSEEFCKDSLILLNTHFTPRDRKLKIYLAKRRLRENKRIIVISTQLIEAGVDIDFPILYRDFTTVASIVQSAGRCNRNGKLKEKGKVYLFRLMNKDKIRSELIYRGRDKDLLRFTKDAFSQDNYQEKDLLDVQCDFFNRIKEEFHFAKHWQTNPKIEFDFIKDIQECMYDKIGKFQLIDKDEYGNERQYYVPINAKDNKFEILLEKQANLINLLKQKANIFEIQNQKKEIEFYLKKMANQIVQIRLKNETQKQLLRGSDNSYFDLWKINLSKYSFEKGINLQGEDVIL